MERSLKVAVAALAGTYLLGYVVLALLRMGYPYELEWLEGGVVDHVRWILAGHPLYGKPSLEFTPFIYTPLYYYLSAAVTHLTGLGFWPLRLESFLASLGCLVLIYLLVRRETESKWAGFLAAGLFAATYRVSGAWLDLARVDSVALLLFLMAVYVLRWYESRWGLITAGLLVGLSFLTKQQALFMSPPLMAYSVFFHRKRALYFVGAAIVVILGSKLLFDAATDGWYSFYTFELPQHHQMRWKYLILFWTRDFWPPLMISFLLTAMVLAIRGQAAGGSEILRKQFFYYLCLLAGMIGAAWTSRMHAGGYDNALIPGCAALAIGLGLAAAGVEEWVERPDLSAFRAGLTSAFYAAVLLQFANLFYDPLDQLPKRGDREAGDALVKLIASYPGDVWLTHHGYLPSLAGKGMHTHPYAIFDIQQVGGPVAEEILREMRQAVSDQEFDAIICDQRGIGETRFEPQYSMVDTVFADQDVFRPVTGARTRPEYVFERRLESKD